MIRCGHLVRVFATKLTARKPIVWALVAACALALTASYFLRSSRGASYYGNADDASASGGFVGRLITDSQALYDRADTFDCLQASFAGLSGPPVPICLFADDENPTGSANIRRGRYYEEDVVARFLAVLRRHPEMTFVDLGANLGLYALPIARRTIVVAVEPFRRTMRRLATSAELGGVAANMLLVNNAVSSRRARYRILVNNPVGLQMPSTCLCSHKLGQIPSCRPNRIASIPFVYLMAHSAAHSPSRLRLRNISFTKTESQTS